MSNKRKHAETMKLTAKQEIALSIKLTKQLQVVQKSIETLKEKIYHATYRNGKGNIPMMEEELIAKYDVEAKLTQAIIEI